MRTPASIAGRPIHPMLIVFPVGLSVFSLVCDLLSIFTATAQTWALVALYTMVAAFAAVFAAAMPRLRDVMSLSNVRVKALSLAPMSLNLLAATLYAVNLWLRIDGAENRGPLLWISVAAVGLVVVAGWFGAEKAHRQGLSLDSEEARPGRPSSQRIGSGSTAVMHKRH